MIYIDVRSMSEEERGRRKRQLLLEQVSYQSDLKKVEREQLLLREQLRRFEQDRARLDVDIAQNKESAQKLTARTDFIAEELRRIKKTISELG